jgi:hypothetical protein
LLNQEDARATLTSFRNASMRLQLCRRHCVEISAGHCADFADAQSPCGGQLRLSPIAATFAGRNGSTPGQ